MAIPSLALRASASIRARLGFKGMHYKLSFLDDAGHAIEACELDFEDDRTALLWMQVVGGQRVLHVDWALMELRCNRRSIARVPASVLERAWKAKWHFPSGM